MYKGEYQTYKINRLFFSYTRHTLQHFNYIQQQTPATPHFKHHDQPLLSKPTQSHQPHLTLTHNHATTSQPRQHTPGIRQEAGRVARGGSRRGKSASTLLQVKQTGKPPRIDRQTKVQKGGIAVHRRRGTLKEDENIITRLDGTRAAVRSATLASQFVSSERILNDYKYVLGEYKKNNIRLSEVKVRP